MKTNIKILSIFAFAFIFLLTNTKVAGAMENPLDFPNNPFGIHIIDENDLVDASNLVNSSGGDWGYITLVIREDERNSKRWQEVFNKMRRLHLIPIVRIASKQENGGWKKHTFEEINNWTSFLNSLNWVIKNRYIVIGNEPNHATEWGGKVNPEEYTDYLISFSETLKKESEDYFILPAGLDASAPDDLNHMSESDFLRRMIKHNENVFDHIDGWASHSYPNPDFSGSEESVGRGSVKTYEWEINYLKNLGVKKEFPIFITETGWAHNMDGTNNGYNRTDAISQKLETAFETVWKNDSVVAITPFVLNYQSPPFDKFSWKKAGGGFYNFYYDIQNLEKPKGSPKQINSIQKITNILPEIIKRGDKKFGLAYVKNTGQVIWNLSGTQEVEDGNLKMEIEPISFISSIEPNSYSLVFYRTL